jgi:signal recognition particle receptor subunit beta
MTGAVKLVVAGGYGAGKTTLVSTLSDIDPVTTESAITAFGSGLEGQGSGGKTSTTVAFDFGRFAAAPNLMGYLFGLPGQHRFRFLWPGLLRGAFAGLVVVDPERSAEARPALEALRRHGIPAVVVVNAFDGLVLTDVATVGQEVVRQGAEPVLAADVRNRQAVRAATARVLRVGAAHHSGQLHGASSG